MPSRDVEINLVAHDRTGRGTRSAAKNLEQLARKTEKLKSQKLVAGVDTKKAEQKSRGAAARLKKIWAKAGKSSGASFIRGFNDRLSKFRVRVPFTGLKLGAVGTAIGGALATAVIVAFGQAITAALPLLLGGLALAGPIIFLLKKQLDAAKEVKGSEKHLASLKKQLENAKSKATQERLKKEIAAEKRVLAEVSKQAALWLQLKARAKSFITFVSKPFKPFFTNALLTIGDGLDHLKKPLRDMVAALGPALAPFTKGVMKSLISFVKALEPALPGIVAGMQAWGRELPKITKSLGEAFSRILADPETVRLAVEQTSALIQGLASAFAGLIGFLQTLAIGWHFLWRGIVTTVMQAQISILGALATTAEAMGNFALGARLRIALNKVNTDLKKTQKTWAETDAAMRRRQIKALITANIDGFTSKINKVKAQLKDPKLSKAKRLKLELDLAKFRRQRAVAIADLHLLAKTKSKPKLEADKTRLERVIRQGKAQLKKLHGTKTKPKVEADVKAAERKLRQVKAELARLNKAHANPKVTISIGASFTSGMSAAAYKKFINKHTSAEAGWQASAAALDGGGISRTGGPSAINVAAPIVDTRVFIGEREIRSVARSTVLDENRRNAYRARVGRR